MSESDDRIPRTSHTLLMRVRDIEDRKAWNEFVDRYAPLIFNWCRRLRLQETDAADVTQEVLYKLVKAMREFRYDASRGTFRAWLKTVTSNAVRDLVQKWRQPGQGSGDSGVFQLIGSVEDDESLDTLTAWSVFKSRCEITPPFVSA